MGKRSRGFSDPSGDTFDLIARDGLASSRRVARRAVTRPIALHCFEITTRQWSEIELRECVPRTLEQRFAARVVAVQMIYQHITSTKTPRRIKV